MNLHKPSRFFRFPSLLILATTLMIGMPVVHADSSMLTQHIESARDYMNNAQWDYANYEWRAALQESPKNLDAIQGLAESLLHGGYLAEAIQHLETSRKMVDKLTLELTYAQALELTHQYDQAKQVYMHNLERVPLEVNSFRHLQLLSRSLSDDQKKPLADFLAKKADDAAKNGRKAMQDKQYDLAIDNFALSTLLIPNPQDINDYGLALLLQGQYDQALQQFNMLRKIQDKQWDTHANAAMILLGKNRATEAATEMEKAISLCADSPKKPLLYNNLGFIYENQSRWQQAKNAYEHAIELNPNFTKAKMNLAYAYQKDTDYTHAIQTYRDLLKTDPKNEQVWTRLGFVYELAHREKQAISAYKEVSRLVPGSREGYYNLALLYRKMGLNDAADREYRNMMELEFKQMEAGKTASQISRGEVRDPKARLLDYVDIFFSEPTLVGQS